MRYKILLLIFSLSIYRLESAEAQTLQLFEVGHADEWLGNHSYFEPVTLSNDRIIHNSLNKKHYSLNRYLFGDVKISTYTTAGDLLEQETSTADSLFITKTILKTNGEKILLGNTYQHLALYNLDTLNPSQASNQHSSFILHMNAANQTLNYSLFSNVEDMALDEMLNTLYFTEEYAYDSARVYAYNLTTGNKNIITTITRSRYHPRIVKTRDYIYIAGSSINYGVKINDHLETTNLAYATFVIQLKEDGSFNWINMIRDVTTPHMGLAAAPDQGVYLCADLLDPVRVGQDSLLGPTWGNDFLLTRIDSTSRYLWATEAPNNSLCGFALGNGFSLGSDGASNVYVAGSSKGVLKWNNGLEIGHNNNILTPAVLIYDKSGVVKSHVIAEAGEPNFFFSIDVEAQGNFVVNGKISNTLTFDGVTKTVTDGGYHPYFLYYTNPLAALNQTTANKSMLSLYPNPLGSFDMLHIKRSKTGTAMLEFFNLTGYKIHEEMISGQTASLSLNNFEPGMYLARMDGQWQKLVVK